MNEIPLPTPPPMPGRLPRRIIESNHPLGGEEERLHRLAVLHDACPRCAPPPGELHWRDWLADLAVANPAEPPYFDHWVTPEGEIAGFVHGELRVDDPAAFTAWADQHFAKTGPVWAHVITVDGSPWTRAVFWLDREDRLHLHAASLDRFHHLERVFEHVWPPVYRGMASMGAFQGPDLDGQIYKHPPAEVSPYTRLVFRPGTGDDPSATRPDQMPAEMPAETPL